MSDEVIFQEESANTVSNISIVRGAPTGMLAWIVKQKIAKNAKQAESYLLGTAIVLILLAIVVYFLFGVARARLPLQLRTLPGPNGVLVPVSRQ